MAMKAPRSHSSRLKLYYIQFPPKAATMSLLAHYYVRQILGRLVGPRCDGQWQWPPRPPLSTALNPGPQKVVYESIRATSNQPFEAIDNNIMTNPSICCCWPSVQPIFPPHCRPPPLSDYHVGKTINTSVKLPWTTRPVTSRPSHFPATRITRQIVFLNFFSWRKCLEKF